MHKARRLNDILSQNPINMDYEVKLRSQIHNETVYQNILLQKKGISIINYR
jgi:hypothetical protein